MADYSAMAQRLLETWPARAARGAFDAIMLPGQVAGGQLATPPARAGTWSDVDEARQQATQGAMMNRAADLGGMVMGGAYAAPAVRNSVGMGVRSLPTDNYRKPLSVYTDKLYRETSPEAALEVLPGSNVHGGLIAGQPPRHFYSDTPEMALGQGANKGVRVGYDASAFEGQINQSKPMWAPMFEKGSAEYLASPMRDADVRAAVKSINIDKTALASAPRAVQAQFGRLVEKLRTDGWNVADSKQYIDLVRNYGLAGALGGAAMYQGSEAQAAP